MLLRLPKSLTRYARPRHHETSAQWAERAAWLPTEGQSKPGKVDLALTPWVREILNCLDDPHVERVVFEAPRQVAKTTTWFYWLGKTVEHDPSPVVIVHADGDIIKNFNRERLQPFIEATPVLRDLKDTDRDLFMAEDMHFVSGMWINCVGARAVMKLSQRAARYVVCEEVNKYKYTLGEHSNPLSEVEKTTTTFWGGKVYASSTPTNQFGMISRLVNLCEEIRWWYVECPHCRKEITLNFSNETFQAEFAARFRFERHPDDKMIVTAAWFECPECHQRITEHHKRDMQQTGRWKAMKCITARKPKSIGFQLGGLNSLAAKRRWVDIAERWLKACKALEQEPRPDIEPMRDFMNNVMGVPWEIRDVNIDHEVVMARRSPLSPGIVPADVDILVAAFDRHGSDFHFVVYGFRPAMGMYLVQHGIIPKTWEMLKLILEQKFKREDGNALTLFRAGMDCAYEQEEVFSLCRQTNGFIVPVKGSEQDRARPAYFKIDPKLGDSDANLWIQNPVNRYKDELALRFEMPAGSEGDISFHSKIDEDFSKQMVGQQRVGVLKTDSKGRTFMVHVWQDRPGFKVHFWDASVLALGLGYAKAVDVIIQQRKLQGQAPAPTQPDLPQESVPEKPTGDWLKPTSGSWIRG